MIEFGYYTVPVSILGEAIDRLSLLPTDRSENTACELTEVRKLLAEYDVGLEASILPGVIVTRFDALRHALIADDLSEWAWQVDDDTWAMAKPLVYAAGQAPLKLVDGQFRFDASELLRLATAFSDGCEE